MSRAYRDPWPSCVRSAARIVTPRAKRVLLLLIRLASLSHRRRRFRPSARLRSDARPDAIIVQQRRNVIDTRRVQLGRFFYRAPVPFITVFQTLFYFRSYLIERVCAYVPCANGLSSRRRPNVRARRMIQRSRNRTLSASVSAVHNWNKFKSMTWRVYIGPMRKKL